MKYQSVVVVKVLNFKRHKFFLCVVGLLLIGEGVVWGQEEALPSSTLEVLYTRLESLSQDQRVIIETLERTLQETLVTREELKAFLQKLELRLGVLENELLTLKKGKPSLASPERAMPITEKPPVVPAPKREEESAPPERKSVEQAHPPPPEELYNDAYNHIRNLNFVAAKEAFSAFLSSYPTHALASNAAYWLGETHYVQQDYGGAAKVFLEGYKSYIDSQKAPHMLLKLAMSLKGLGHGEEACKMLIQLEEDHAPLELVVEDRVMEEKKRMACE